MNATINHAQFEEIWENYLNGNKEDFRNELKKMNKLDIINMVSWSIGIPPHQRIAAITNNLELIEED